GLTQREEIRSRASVRDARQIRLGLVDVVLPLDQVHQGKNVVDLARVPPGVLVGGLRLDVDLRLAGNARRLWLTAWLRRTADAAVQLHANRPFPRQVVLGRYLDQRFERLAANRRRTANQAGLFARIRPAGFQPH